MKKLILLFSVILACCLPGKVSALDIKPEKEYCIMHSYTHMYLTNNKSWAGAVLETYTGAEDQRYKFGKCGGSRLFSYPSSVVE